MAYNKTNWVDNQTAITADKLNNIENGITELSKYNYLEPVMTWYAGDDETVQVEIDSGDLFTMYLWVNTHIFNLEIVALSYYKPVGSPLSIKRLITDSNQTQFSVNTNTNILTITGAAGCRGTLYKFVQKYKTQ